MVNIKVNDSLRKKKRVLRDALGDDILRYIAELITNSDDSYRRMEDNNLCDAGIEKNIYLEVLKEKDNYIVSVTDNAEGMTLKQLKKIFGVYGGDNSGGEKYHTRGIFGQGASDVLRASASDNKIAKIETIKNNKVAVLEYKMDKEYNPSIELEEIHMTKNKLKKYKEEIKIPNNGTKITFGIPKRVTFNKKIKDSLPTLISAYPTFRYLLNQSNRKLIYIEPFMNTVIDSKNYQFIEDNKIDEKEFKFRFENQRMECILKLYKNEHKNIDHTDIIVRDENYIVFDNTMFAFANSPLSQNISGELIINGLYGLCYEHLNRDDPDAIIRDNRTGFDTKNEFYNTLCRSVNPLIDEVLKKYGPDVESTDLSNNKRFNEILKRINKYLETEIKSEISGGNLEGEGKKNINGLKFARNMVTLTKGKTYNINLYINSEMILPNEDIIIDILENDCISVEPLKLSYDEVERESTIVTKKITIKAINNTIEPVIIKASCNDLIDELRIEVIEDDVYYPKNGMEFYPNKVTQMYDKPHNLKLFIDKDYVPIGSIINISCDGLEVLNNCITFEKKHLINDNIGVIGINLIGGLKDHVYSVKAKYQDILAEASLSLIEKNKKEKLGGGLIESIILEASDKPYQSMYNPYTHVITINTKNPINMIILGDMSDIDHLKPVFRKKYIKYLADIIAFQVATIIVKQNIQNSEIDINNIDDYDKIELSIQEHKNKIYGEMYPVLLAISE